MLYSFSINLFSMSELDAFVPALNPSLNKLLAPNFVPNLTIFPNILPPLLFFLVRCGLGPTALFFVIVMSLGKFRGLFFRTSHRRFVRLVM